MKLEKNAWKFFLREGPRRATTSVVIDVYGYVKNFQVILVAGSGAQAIPPVGICC